VSNLGNLVFLDVAKQLSATRTCKNTTNGSAQIEEPVSGFVLAWPNSEAQTHGNEFEKKM
jgi:hypothetical protein